MHRRYSPNHYIVSNSNFWLFFNYCSSCLSVVQSSPSVLHIQSSFTVVGNNLLLGPASIVQLELCVGGTICKVIQHRKLSRSLDNADIHTLRDFTVPEIYCMSRLRPGSIFYGRMFPDCTEIARGFLIVRMKCVGFWAFISSSLRQGQNVVQLEYEKDTLDAYLAENDMAVDRFSALMFQSLTYNWWTGTRGVFIRNLLIFSCCWREGCASVYIYIVLVWFYILWQDVLALRQDYKGIMDCEGITVGMPDCFTECVSMAVLCISYLVER